MRPIAALVADLHLTLTAPSCRQEEDWKQYQAGCLRFLKEVAGDAPILIAGDIFDRWNIPPELIHFALQELPDGAICVPGQHDLPYHRNDLIFRSAYGVLVASGKIVHCDRKVVRVGDLTISGAGWGTKNPKPGKGKIRLALVHRYLWCSQKTAFPDAPEDGNILNLSEFDGFDVVVSGDNHIPWQYRKGSTFFYNCGSFFRRKVDETHRPRVGLLMEDGSIQPVELPNPGELVVKGSSSSKLSDFQEFIENLESLSVDSLDFRSTVLEYLKKNPVEPPVEEIVLKSIES